MKIRGKFNYLLKKYILILASYTAFLCLNMQVEISFVFSVLIAVAGFGILIFKTDIVSETISNASKSEHILSVFTSVGICLQSQINFRHYRRYLNQLVDTDINAVKIIGIIGALAAFYFVYVLSLFFINRILSVLKDGLQGITKYEIYIYIVMIMATVLVMTLVFLKTNAFYGSPYNYDVIYTSDSAAIVRGNSYLYLVNGENDLRQPLFMIFAAPFMAIPYLIGKIFGNNATSQAIMMNAMQIVMMYTANFMLSKVMRLNGIKRVCFMVLCSFTYTNLLFSLMMEQYIVAYFWLIVCIYYIDNNRSHCTFAICGAGGTMLTSLVLTPFISEANPFKNFKVWFNDMFKAGITFLSAILILGRFDIIYNAIKSVSTLMSYTGVYLTSAEKFCQYTGFVANCFVAQKAGPTQVLFPWEPEFISGMAWRSMWIESVNNIGVVIFIVALLSVIVNRSKSSLICFGWMIFSFIMLFGLGWGTAENGLVLYTLYFGWPFLVLVFQLFEKIEDIMKAKYIVPVFTVMVLTVMAIINIPSVIEMIGFAIEYYPI